MPDKVSQLEVMKEATQFASNFWDPHIKTALAGRGMRVGYAERAASFSLEKDHVWQKPEWVRVRLDDKRYLQGQQVQVRYHLQVAGLNHESRFSKVGDAFPGGLKVGDLIAAYYHDDLISVRFIRKLDETVAGDAEIIKKNNYAGITMKQEYFVDVESISVPWKQIVKRESPGDLFRVKLEEAGITDPTGTIHRKAERPIKSLAPHYIKNLKPEDAIPIPAVTCDTYTDRVVLQFKVKVHELGPNNEKLRQFRSGTKTTLALYNPFTHVDGQLSVRYTADGHFLPYVSACGPQGVTLRFWEFKSGEDWKTRRPGYLSAQNRADPLMIKELEETWPEFRRKYDYLARIVENDLDRGYYDEDDDVTVHPVQDENHSYVKDGVIECQKFEEDKAKAKAEAAETAETGDDGTAASKPKKRASKEEAAAKKAEKAEAKARKEEAKAEKAEAKARKAEEKATKEAGKQKKAANLQKEASAFKSHFIKKDA